MNYTDVLKDLPTGLEEFEPRFAFSVHKNGSTLMYGMLRTVAEILEIPAASIPDMVFNQGILDKEWMADPDIVPYFRRNLFYYGFRAFPAALADPSIDLAQRRFVLLVRDPRDALVSQYFSYGKKNGSHRAPVKNDQAFRNNLAKMNGERDIDEYALWAAPNLLSKLEAYRSNLNFANGILCLYEDAYFDKESLLIDIFAHLEIDVPNHVLKQVADQYDVRPETEDETKHIRKGTPGDHVEKLKPETIAALNDQFREIGTFFGYSL